MPLGLQRWARLCVAVPVPVRVARTRRRALSSTRVPATTADGGEGAASAAGASGGGGAGDGDGSGAEGPELSIYDSVSKTKLPLPRREGPLTWYQCGPTVYDSAHIGHACSFVRFDIVHRLLRDYFRFNVLKVWGMTDIDDKIIARAHERQRPWQELAAQYEQEFYRDMSDLGVAPPYRVTRVSDNIQTIITFVKTLEQRGYAYASPSGVYFDTEAWGHKGGLHPTFRPNANQDVLDVLDSLPAGHRKRRADFALWKRCRPEEPSWESPWGHGRPGWHIECSAMSTDALGHSLDLHSGGMDLKFPHHENEILQSEAHFGSRPFVRCWMHSGHLYMANFKMSKSLGNTITIQQFLQSHTAQQFRMLCLLTHYRARINLSDKSMVKPVAMLARLESFVERASSLCQWLQRPPVRAHTWSPAETALLEELAFTRQQVDAHLRDDFDCPNALEVMFSLITEANTYMDRSNPAPFLLLSVLHYVQHVFDAVGIPVRAAAQSAGTPAADATGCIDSAVAFRHQVRLLAMEHRKTGLGQELLKHCDTFRDQLGNMPAPVVVEDHKGGSVWHFRQLEADTDGGAEAKEPGNAHKGRART